MSRARRRCTVTLCLGAVFAAIRPSLATAQPAPLHRAGLPDVLAPPAAPSAHVVEEQFRDTYARAGRPRFVLYWNRELDDELVDRKTQRVDIRAAAVEAGPVTAGAVQIDRAESISNRAPTGGLPRRLAAVETAFVQTLTRHGVRLVDRAAILRIEHARARKGKAGAQPAPADTRLNEIDALSAHADLLLEIIVLEAGGSPDEVEFKLIAKDTRSGAMPFSLTTRAQAPGSPAKGGFVAGEAGFVREPVPPRSMQDAGRQLAVDTMAAWNAAQARR